MPLATIAGDMGYAVTPKLPRYVCSCDQQDAICPSRNNRHIADKPDVNRQLRLLDSTLHYVRGTKWPQRLDAAQDSRKERP